VAQDDHRGLSRYPTDLAVHELIGHEITDDHDAPLGKLRDQVSQTMMSRRIGHKITG
jgi:hypothetical protein